MRGYLSFVSIDFSAGIRFSLSRIIILKIHKNGLYGKIVSLQNIISDRDFFNRRFDRRKKERRLELISTRQNVLIVADRN